MCLYRVLAFTSNSENSRFCVFFVIMCDTCVHMQWFVAFCSQEKIRVFWYAFCQHNGRLFSLTWFFRASSLNPSWAICLCASMAASRPALHLSLSGYPLLSQAVMCTALCISSKGLPLQKLGRLVFLIVSDFSLHLHYVGSTSSVELQKNIQFLYNVGMFASIIHLCLNVCICFLR